MSADLLTIDGTVGIRERIAIPSGAVATVKVVDGDGEVLAATAVAAEGVPVPFSVAIDPNVVTDPSKLFVWAALRTEVGWWGTVDLAPAAPGDDIVLTKIPD